MLTENPLYAFSLTNLYFIYYLNNGLFLWVLVLIFELAALSFFYKYKFFSQIAAFNLTSSNPHITLCPSFFLYHIRSSFSISSSLNLRYRHWTNWARQDNKIYRTARQPIAQHEARGIMGRALQRLFCVGHFRGLDLPGILQTSTSCNASQH